MATRNRAQEAVGTLHRLEALPERPPIVVVENGSTDGTPDAIAREHPHVRVIGLGENIGGAARNVGVDACEAEYVAFADDDSWWEPGSLARAAAVFDAHPRLAAVSARVVVGPEETLDPVCAELEASPLPATGLPGPAILGFLACGAARCATATCFAARPTRRAPPRGSCGGGGSCRRTSNTACGAWRARAVSGGGWRRARARSCAAR